LVTDGADWEPEIDVLNLWDDRHGFVKNAVSYGREWDEEEELAEGYGVMSEGES
jgi:hypothetical protein